MVGIGLVSFKPDSVDGDTKRELVPMTGIDFQIKLMDYSAQVTIRQRFENRESNPIEATYEIILPRECAVTSFTATVAGQRVNAVIREKEAAKDEYEDGIAAGGSAVLLENDTSDDKPDVFRVSVGNLAPHEVATVALTYVTTADVNDAGDIEFTLPAAQGHQDIAIAPPSSVDNANDDDDDNDDNFVADGIHLTADIEMGSDIRSVTSPTHKVTFELRDTPKRARVTLNESLRGGEDFTLTVRTAEPRAPSARIHRPSAEKAGATVMVSFFPELDAAFGEDEDTGLKEMVFVVDRSGSMSGSKVENAKSTLQLFLRSIPEGTLFNIVSFGSSFSKLFEGGSRALDDATLEQATAHVAGMKANMGGTNLSSPLASVLSEAPRDGVPRLLFVLTDGEVSDPEECMRCIREQAGTTRVFTFGIGRDASIALVRGMARAGEGLCELIEDATGMGEKVMRQLKRAMRPALTGLTVEWEGCGECGIRQAPFVLPPLFGGSRIVVYGLAENGEALGAGSVVLRGVLGGSKRFESRVSLGGATVSVGSDEEQITKLAAAALIRDLAEDRSYRGKGYADRDKEIVRVSLENGVLSKLTAFVAVAEGKRDGGEGAAQESMVERPVVIEPYAPGFHHEEHAAMGDSSCEYRKVKKRAGGISWFMKSIFGRFSRARFAAAAVSEPCTMECCDDAYGSCGIDGGDDSADSKRWREIQEKAVLSQSANGSWGPDALGKIDSVFANAVDDMIASMKAGGKGSESELVSEDETFRRVCATLIVVAILEVFCNKAAAEWEILKDKAIRWVKKVSKGIGDGSFNVDEWKKAAVDIISLKKI